MTQTIAQVLTEMFQLFDPTFIPPQRYTILPTGCLDDLYVIQPCKDCGSIEECLACQEPDED